MAIGFTAAAAGIIIPPSAWGSSDRQRTVVLEYSQPVESVKTMVIYGLYVFAVVVGLFLLSLLAVGILLLSLPATYFLDSHVRQLWVDHHPVVRMLLHVVKNLVGMAVVVAGLLLMVTGIPGQAVVTLLLGVMLLDFPGKTRLERKLVSYPWLLQRVNHLRQWFDRPPLVMDEPPRATVSPDRSPTGLRLGSRSGPTTTRGLADSDPGHRLA